MIRPNELRSVVNETVLEWIDTCLPAHAVLPFERQKLVDQLVENIQEVWYN